MEQAFWLVWNFEDGIEVIIKVKKVLEVREFLVMGNMQIGIKTTTGNKHLQKQYRGSSMLDDLLKNHLRVKCILMRYLCHIVNVKTLT